MMSVNPGSMAETCGVQPGWTIVAVGGHHVADLASFNGACAQIKEQGMNPVVQVTFNTKDAAQKCQFMQQGLTPDGQQPGMPPQQPGMPPQQPGMAPQQPGMAPQQPGMAPQQPGEPPQGPGAPPQLQPGMPPIPDVMDIQMDLDTKFGWRRQGDSLKIISVTQGSQADQVRWKLGEGARKCARASVDLPARTHANAPA